MKIPKIPATIKIEDGADIELSKLHACVLDLFAKNRKKRLAEVDKKLEKISHLEKYKQAKKLKKWNLIRSNIESGEDAKEFQINGNLLVQDYNKNISEYEKTRILNEYLELLGTIIEINVVKKAEECRSDFQLPTFVGNNASKGPREDDKTERDNFHKSFLSLQNKRAANIPEDLLNKLDIHFGKFEHLQSITRKNIENVPLRENGVRKGTSKLLMQQALHDTGNSSFYDKINAICATYWKWKLPDLSNFEKQIMIDFDFTQEEYHDMKKNKHPLLNRKSNLNIQYRLFKHLQARGHQCRVADFKMIDGRDILIDYDQIWKIMVERANVRLETLGYEPILYIPTV
jgi:hypothetical protein